jgi:hypothetical protein
MPSPVSVFSCNVLGFELGTLSRYSGMTGSWAAARSDRVASSITAKKAFFMKEVCLAQDNKNRIRIHRIKGSAGLGPRKETVRMRNEKEERKKGRRMKRFYFSSFRSNPFALFPLRRNPVHPLILVIPSSCES